MKSPVTTIRSVFRSLAFFDGAAEPTPEEAAEMQVGQCSRR